MPPKPSTPSNPGFQVGGIPSRVPLCFEASELNTDLLSKPPRSPNHRGVRFGCGEDHPRRARRRPRVLKLYASRSPTGLLIELCSRRCVYLSPKEAEGLVPKPLSVAGIQRVLAYAVDAADLGYNFGLHPQVSRCWIGLIASCAPCQQPELKLQSSMLPALGYDTA